MTNDTMTILILGCTLAIVLGILVGVSNGR